MVRVPVHMIVCKVRAMVLAAEVRAGLPARSDVVDGVVATVAVANRSRSGIGVGDSSVVPAVTAGTAHVRPGTTVSRHKCQ